MLSLYQVSYSVAGKKLLTDIDLNITSGNRIGIVGRNGSGKSHFLKILSGELQPDSGNRKVIGQQKVLLVRQELPDLEKSPLEYLQSIDPELIALQKELDDPDLDDIRFGEINDEIVAIESERYERFAENVLCGLGLKKAEHDAPLKNLSGGYQMRVSLASALIQMPDILLMDEPTNHLDFESVAWLVSFLKSYSKNKIFIIVSHDIHLLNQLTEATLHLKGGKITHYGGNYDVYKRESVIKLENDLKKNAELNEQIDEKTTFYYEFRQRPARAGQAMDRLRQVEVLKEQIVEIIPERPIIPIKFDEPTSLSNPIINLENVTIGYGNTDVLCNINLSIQNNLKLGILGRNGQGKSTLVKMLTERLKESSGNVSRNPKLKVGYFSQAQTDELNVNLTVFEQFKFALNLSDQQDIRNKLSAFGFSKDDIDTRVTNLSGGELSRLAFSIICARSPNLIVLDEPTNHLDIETREKLAKAIKAFPGAVLLISHDWDLHEATMEKYWLVENKKVNEYKQSIQEYQKKALMGFEQGNNKTKSGSVDKKSKKHEFSIETQTAKPTKQSQVDNKHERSVQPSKKGQTVSQGDNYATMYGNKKQPDKRTKEQSEEDSYVTTKTKGNGGRK